jgi:hypothetical protein
MIFDSNGNCVCPEDKGYVLRNGYCEPLPPTALPPTGCTRDDDCADDKYCAAADRTCQDPCKTKICGLNAYCLALNHQATCICKDPTHVGNPNDPEGCRRK